MWSLLDWGQCDFLVYGPLNFHNINTESKLNTALPEFIVAQSKSTSEDYFNWYIWFYLCLYCVINYSVTVQIINMSLHQWHRDKFLHNTLTVLGEQKLECQDGDWISDLDLRPKRISWTLLCFGAFAGWVVCIHLSEQTTGGTVTKTGWFWASSFNCDSAAICACVSIHVTIQSSGFVCVYAVCCRLLD